MIYLSNYPAILLNHHLKMDLREEYKYYILKDWDEVSTKLNHRIAFGKEGPIAPVYIIKYTGKTIPKELPNNEVSTIYLCVEQKTFNKWHKLLNEYVKLIKLDLNGYQNLIYKEGMTSDGFNLFWELCQTKFQFNIKKWVGESYKLKLYAESRGEKWSAHEIQQMYVGKTTSVGYQYIPNFFNKNALSILNQMSDNEIYMSIIGTKRKNYLATYIEKTHPEFLYPFSLLIEAISIPTLSVRNAAYIFHKWLLLPKHDTKKLKNSLGL